MCRTPSADIPHSQTFEAKQFDPSLPLWVLTRRALESALNEAALRDN